MSGEKNTWKFNAEFFLILSEEIKHVLEMADRHEMVDRHEMEMFMLRSKDEGSKLGVEPGNDDRAGTFPKMGAWLPSSRWNQKRKSASG